MSFLPRLTRQAVLIRVKLGLTALLVPAIAWSAQSFQIPAGRLDQVLNQFALEADIEFYLNASLSEDIYSEGIQGDFDPAQALTLLLENTGLVAEPQEDGSFILTPLNSAMTLDAIQVRTHFDDEIARDETGELDVYDADTSTAYISKEEIERFKGASGADLFTGMANTFSGEARNGGSSIDANIRGVQGQGRVPVVIDGTEQGITIWNGYRGASNRNYIDSNLISGLQVHKGAQLNSDINTSVGGAVEVTTLQPQDIIAEGEAFGMEVVVEGSSNSVAPYQARMHTGKHWQDVPIYNEQGGIDWYNDPELRFETRDNKSDNPFGGEDVAFRFAASGISDKFEWLGAIAYRKRGNYYSGTKKADFYKQPYNPDTLGIEFLQPRHAALNHLPGHEVFNTSSEMHSYLLKTTYKFSDFEKVQFNARFTESKHGEIMASRSDYRNNYGMAQWPLGSAKLQAYSVKYRVNPKSRFLNLSTDLWTTLSDTVTNTAGGFPNTVVTEPEGNGIIFNTATAYNKERRIGANFKNTMLLSDNWDMTVSGHYQHHTVEPKQGMKYLVDKYNATVRAGERTEFNGAAKVEWRASDSLIFNAGLRYGKYESEDHYLKYRIENKNDKRKLGEYITEGYLLSYQTREVYEPEEITQRVANAEHDIRITFTRDALDKEITTMTGLIATTTAPSQIAEYQSRLASAQASLANFDSLLKQKIKLAVAKVENEKTYLRTHTQEWRNDSNSKLSMKRNACVIAMSRPNYVKNSCKFTRLPDIQRYKSKYANSGSGWMPSLTATWLLSDNKRAYVRYAETLRFPSLFESTSGFSASHLTSSPLQPERATLWELGYVHYFDNSNMKLVHFDQTITDIIDRDIRTRAFGNLEFQNTKGLELQASYDDEIYFGEFSAAYNYHNEVCDDNSASQKFISGIADENKEVIDLCTRGGFSNISYLGSYANPEYSANLLVGSRFLNQTLETGVRSNYLSGSHHEDLIERTHSLTFDAFAKYQINESVDLELVGTNLLDLYYLELGSISGIPAPGRTFSIKLKGKF